MKEKIEVYKSKNLWQAHDGLTTFENKIVALAVSKLNPFEDKDLKPVQITYDEFKALNGQEKAQNYTQLYKSCQRIHARQIKIKEDNKNWGFYHYFDAIESKNGIVHFHFSQVIKHHLIQLSDYSKDSLVHFFSLSNQYSSGVYKLIFPLIWKEPREKLFEFELKIADIRGKLFLEKKYPDYRDFKKRVLIPAFEDISQKTDIKILDFKTKGKPIETLILTLMKTDRKEQLYVQTNLVDEIEKEVLPDFLKEAKRKLNAPPVEYYYWTDGQKKVLSAAKQKSLIGPFFDEEKTEKTNQESGIFIQGLMEQLGWTKYKTEPKKNFFKKIFT